MRNKIDLEAVEVVKKITNTFRTGKTSVYILFHYSQMITKKTFEAYNWQATDENISRYSLSQPPAYQLNRINVPVFVFWSDVDTIASAADVDKLKLELSNLKLTYQLPFSHIDYLWGEDAALLLYTPICDILNVFT